MSGTTQVENTGTSFHTTTGYTAKTEEEIEQYTGTMRKSSGSEDAKNCYSTIPGSQFNVRGKQYLQDKKKYPSKDCLCELLASDVLLSPVKISNICSHPDVVGTVEALRKKRAPAGIFVLCFLVPANPHNVHLVMYFAMPEAVNEENQTGVALLRRFISRDEPNEFRDTRLKIIPGISHGPWIVRTAVGNTPAILPPKIDTTYHWGDGYFEADVDVGSSVAGGAIWGLVKNYLKSLVIDLAFLLEGKDESELPEQVLGAIRLNFLTVNDHTRILSSQQCTLP